MYKSRLSKKIIWLAEISVLLSIVILMTFTPLGYLPIGPLRLTLIPIPVVIGAIMLGPSGGAVLGLAFGISSFITCFTGDPFGAALVSINMFYTFVLCVIPRLSMGFLTAIVFNILKSFNLNSKIAISSILGVIFNTLFFMGTLVLLFGNTPPVELWAAGLGANNFIMFIILAAGMNFICEVILTIIIAAPVSKVLLDFSEKQRLSN